VHNTSNVLLSFLICTVPLNIMTKNHAMRRNCRDNFKSYSNFKRLHACMYKKLECGVCHQKYLNSQSGTAGIFSQTQVDTCHGQMLCVHERHEPRSMSHAFVLQCLMLRSASSCCCSSTGNAWYLQAQPKSALNAGKLVRALLNMVNTHTLLNMVNTHTLLS